jgi:hypothetical protein
MWTFPSTSPSHFFRAFKQMHGRSLNHSMDEADDPRNVSGSLAANPSFQALPVTPLPVNQWRRNSGSLLRSLTIVVLCLIEGCGPEVPGSTETHSAAQSGKHAAIRFEDCTEATGIRFQHCADGTQEHYFPAIMTGGGALTDFDSDGRLDVLLLDSRRLARETLPLQHLPSDAPGKSSVCHLFLQAEDGTFTDASVESGLLHFGYATGCTAGDINNDGLNDLYVTAAGADQLFVNVGGGHFRDATEESGILNSRWSTSVAFIDFDRDGWLDIFVTNYVQYDPGVECGSDGAGRDFCNPAVFPRTSDRLFRNVSGEAATRGGVKFQDVSVTSGIAGATGAGLGVITADFNHDGWQDIYVANDGHGNSLWINQQNGTFVDEAVLYGVAYDALGQGQGSMGLALADINADEKPDLFVTNLDGESIAVYQSRSSGFVEASRRTGVFDLSFSATGFGLALFDANNDGFNDLAAANGRVRRKRNSAQQTASATERKSPEQNSTTSPPGIDGMREYREHSTLMFGNEKGFVAVTSPDTDFPGVHGVARSLCAGDLNNDGRVDLLVTFLDRTVGVYRNTTEPTGHWVQFSVIEPRLGGRDAIGAVVSLTVPGKRLTRWVSGGGSYQCASDSRVHFGLGETDHFDRVEVLWPDGERERFSGGQSDCIIQLRHGDGEIVP